MYNENNNNEQNNGYTNNGHPQEYYYSTGSQNYQNNSTPARKPKKQHPFAKKAVSFVCLGALFGVTAGTAFSVPTYMTNKQLLQAKAELEQAQSEAAAASTPTLSTTTSSLTTSSSGSTASADVSAIAASCLPSVVSITNKGVSEVRTMFGTYQQDTESSGSGIIIGENDTELLIVTNYHVVSGSNELSVVFSYDEDSDNPSLVSAKLKGYDSDKDLAVISVALSDITDDMKSQIKIATIGDSSSLQLGQEVVAIGNALGYGQSVTTGIISALNREVSVTNDDGTSITNKLIQTDAAINPGNSGGALVNMQGELIGINTAKYSDTSVEGMGYALPISDVQDIINDLIAGKNVSNDGTTSGQAYLGISAQTITSQYAQLLNMPEGVYISSVEQGSAAEECGLQSGDIICSLDGEDIADMETFHDKIVACNPGDKVTIVYYRNNNGNYEKQTATATLKEKQ